MGSCLSDDERKILAVIQRGLPLSSTPYIDMAAEIGIETEVLLTKLEQWQQEGKLRRIGAILNHFKVGLESGAMVTWKVEPGRVDEVGGIFTEQKAVSHAYERRITENWPWNIYTMVHAKNDEELKQTIERMSDISGISEYHVLATKRELKKAPPVYITESEI